MIKKNIVQVGWISKYDGRFTNPLDKVRCSYCNHSLQKWYVNALEKLKGLLPENYKPLCCVCAFSKAYKIPKQCPQCGSSNMNIGWMGTAGSYMSAGFQCFNCWWKIQFSAEKVEKKIKNRIVVCKDYFILR